MLDNGSTTHIWILNSFGDTNELYRAISQNKNYTFIAITSTQAAVDACAKKAITTVDKSSLEYEKLLTSITRDYANITRAQYFLSIPSSPNDVQSFKLIEAFSRPFTLVFEFLSPPAKTHLFYKYAKAIGKNIQSIQVATKKAAHFIRTHIQNDAFKINTVSHTAMDNITRGLSGKAMGKHIFFKEHPQEHGAI